MSDLLIPRKPCLYCRLSYAPDGSLEKVERQEADGRAMGMRLNWPDFCCVYVDNSRSAWQRNRRRPRWDAMLVSLEPHAEHHHDGIMVYHGDRLIRQPYDLELLLNIADTRRVPLASVSGVRDLSNPDDRFILRIEAAQACRESDNTSRRVKRGIKARVNNKTGARARPGGRRPYGWGLPTGKTRSVTDRETGEQREVPVLDLDKPVPGEIRNLADVAERLLAGLSKCGAVRWMNERSTTSMGNPWQLSTLSRALTAWRMAGLVEHEGTLYKAAWDPVYSLETLEALRALFAQGREEHGYHGSARSHLLSGIGECFECHTPDGAKPNGAKCTTGFDKCETPHHPLWTKPVGSRGQKSRIYYCRLCGRGRNEVLLDSYVSGRVVHLLNTPALLAELRAVADTKTPGLLTEIAALKRRKSETTEQLKNLADHPNVDPTLALTMLASFDTRIAEKERQLETTSRHRLLLRMVGISRDEWENEPIDVRAEVVRSLYRVIMLPARRGPGFDPSSVRLIRSRLDSLKADD